jgi:cell division topological specificity factor
MFENIRNIFKKSKKRELLKSSSKDTAKERLHLVLMQDRANVSADFLDLMRMEIIEVIKKYIDIDEEAMDVRLTTETNEDGVQGAPALYANIPIINIKDETRKLSKTNQENKLNESNNSNKENNVEEEISETKEEIKEEITEENKKEETVEANKEDDVREENAKEEKEENKTNQKEKVPSKENQTIPDVEDSKEQEEKVENN